MRAMWWGFPLTVILAGCAADGVVVSDPLVAAPTNLQYRLEPSGVPGSPSGILLTWDWSNDPALQVWHVYSRGSTSESYRLRGSTTSNSFHDEGIPHLQYYVTAEDDQGAESSPSNAITVDERLALDAPASLSTTTLNGAIALAWSDNSYSANPGAFSLYRVYSASYNLDTDLCGTSWFLEGATASPEFVAGALPNGVPRCFGISAVSDQGYESLWSPIRADTPRPDARNVVLYARQVQSDTSGFRFWRDLDGDRVADANEIGLVGSGAVADIDFSVERDGSGKLFLTPVRAGTGVAVYGGGPVADLTGIDFAPDIAYGRTALEAKPGWGYVFAMDGGDGLARYGAVRVSHVGQNFLILDWSYQTDPGNPELLVGGGFFTRARGGATLGTSIR